MEDLTAYVDKVDAMIGGAIAALTGAAAVLAKYRRKLKAAAKAFREAGK